MQISASYPRGLGLGFGYLSHIHIRADLDVDTKMVFADEDMSQSRLVLECFTRRKIIIFVDAVDECRDQDRDHLIGIFHRLKGKAQIRLDKPRVCLTCRLYPDSQIDGDFIIRLEE